MTYYTSYIKNFLNPILIKRSFIIFLNQNKKYILNLPKISWINEKIKMNKPILAAFDFDHTIVDENSDIVVRKLLPSAFLTSDVKCLYRQDGWTAYMAKIFQLLHQNGYTPSRILDAVSAIPSTPGMESLFKFLNQENCEVIVISDANNLFINHWLKEHNILNIVHSILSNPAHFDNHGQLNIEMYHLQDWCKLSTKNLCKGSILEDYIKKRASEGVNFGKIAYVGDGKNDLCPILKLGENDLAFPRLSYPLIDCIQQMKPLARVHEWKHANEIINVLKKELNCKD